MFKNNLNIQSVNIFKDKNLSLKKTSNFFFEKEKKKKYKFFENVDLFGSFWKNDKKLKKNVILVSGLSRSGHHLLLSILDQHKDIDNCVGEDATIRNIFTLIKIYGSKKIENQIKNSDEKFYIKLSGNRVINKKFVLVNKWLKVSKLKKFDLPHSGTQEINSTAILDFNKFIPKINYSGYLKFLRKKNKIFDNFFEFFFYYLGAHSKLANQNKKKFNLFCYSGMRREINFFLKNNIDIKVIVPFRDFHGFYQSYYKGIYKSVKPNNLILKDIWENWSHKVTDFLKLKKKYSKNIILVSYDDLSKSPLKKTNKILRLLKIKRINKVSASINNKKVFGNSSFSDKKIKSGDIYFYDRKPLFKYKQLPKEYKKLMSLLNKYKI